MALAAEAICDCAIRLVGRGIAQEYVIIARAKDMFLAAQLVTGARGLAVERVVLPIS